MIYTRFKETIGDIVISVTFLVFSLYTLFISVAQGFLLFFSLNGN